MVAPGSCGIADRPPWPCSDHLSSADANAAAQRQLATRDEAGAAILARDSYLRQLGYLLRETSAVSLTEATPSEDPEIPAGIPSAVLARRPDIAAASGGAASSSLGAILSSASRDFGLGMLLSLPVFDGGRHKARVAGATAAADLALAEYRDRLLLTLREVNDHVGAANEGRQHARRMAENLALTRENNAAIVSSAAAGTRSRLAATTSELALLEAEQAWANSRFNSLIEFVSLVSVLGG